MKKLAIVSVICLSGLTFTGLASANTATGVNKNSQVEFSSEGYCSIPQSNNKSIVSKMYLKAYAAKLGGKPSNELCRSIQAEKHVDVVVSKNKWDYRFNRISKGSIIRLPTSTINRLRAERNVLASL